MSSLFNIAAGGQAGFYDYQINDSLRFDDGSSSGLTRTPSSAGNQKTWTTSVWVKRGNISTQQNIFNPQTGGDGVNESQFHFKSDDTLRIYDSGGNRGNAGTSAKFRDVGAWYHIVLRVDTTQATESNRLRIYVNGEQMTLVNQGYGSTYPSQNVNLGWNNTSNHRIGNYQGSNYYFDGYMSEFNHVDGQSLDPTSFGEFKSGVWIPKDTSGLTFGTNGFRLEFGDSSATGDDTSGNGNDYTANNLSAHDVVPDSPTVNYATLNAVDNPALTLSEGNLKFFNNATAHRSARGTFGMASGKWYFECCVSSISNIQSFGLSRQNVPIPAVYTSNVFVLLLGFASPNSLVYIYNDGTVSSAVSRAVSVNDILKLAYDADSGKLWLGINNDYFDSSANVDASANPATGTNPTLTLSEDEPLVPYVNLYANSGTYNVINFGADGTFLGNITSGNNSDQNGYGDFKYAVPSGFLALNSANLPEPAISPLNDDLPEDYFDTVTYAGTSGIQSISDLTFQPDWVWIKNRSIVSSHGIQDSVRGNFRYLASNATTAENTVSGNDWFRSFDSNGFTVSNTRTSDGAATSEWNASGNNYVGWSWLAGGTAVSNTDGSITSSVSANTEAGFSIVTYTGTLSSGTGSNPTVGHGLSSAPEMYISKSRDTASPDSGHWLVWHKDLSDDNAMFLNLTLAQSAVGSGLPDPDSSVFYTQYQSGSGIASNDYVAYCFHSVEGYSKFGIYTGNGSSDGTFVYTGFRPAWVMVKRTNSTGNWWIADNQRPSSFNNIPASSLLYANLNNAEGGTGEWIDFISNGFKIRNTFTDENASGGTYIYMAFAEMPFKYSLGR